jgi:AcrR family transcriptional regulator
MSSAEKPARKYVSTRREQQAADTRKAVLDAAAKQFDEFGWTGTTIAGIAKAAKVSKETIYAVWGNKPAIVAELVTRAIRGDQPGTPLLQQSGPAAALTASTATAKIALFAGDIATVLSRVAPLVEAIGTAAKSDADSATLFASLQAGRRRNLGAFVTALALDLRPGVSAAAATEEVWRLASPELFLLLTRTGGLDLKGYADWLAATLSRLLLP